MMPWNNWPSMPDLLAPMPSWGCVLIPVNLTPDKGKAMNEVTAYGTAVVVAAT